MPLFRVQKMILLLLVALLGVSCSTTVHDEQLERAAAITDTSPKAALALLDSIEYNHLSDVDRHYFDFLYVKANDKAWVKHFSDSLILDVIKYYKGNNDIYPEALYYGGRVYSDLGDAPTALQYFNKALSQIPDDEKHTDLLCRTLSQKGWILTNLSLFDEAIPCLESVLEIDYPTNDSTNIFADLHVLGGALIRAHEYTKAENTFRQALNYCTPGKSSSDAAECRMYLAWAKHKLGQTDSALHYIRGTKDKVSPIERNSVCGYACRIYLKAGVLDTAFMYAHDLITSADTTNKDVGYHVILSPELRGLMLSDTLQRYISEYEKILYTRYNHSQLQKAIHQENQYNYQCHEHAKNKTEQSNVILWHGIIGLAILIFVLILMVICVVRWYKTQEKQQAAKLQKALLLIDSLKSGFGNTSDDRHDDVTPASTDPPTKSTKGLRSELKKELLSISQHADSDVCISPVIIQSNAYHEVISAINTKRIIKDGDPLWKDLEQTILQSSPQFMTNLYILSLGNLTVRDINTALLYKCGIRLSQMTILFGVTNGAIIYRRRSLSEKLLGEKYDSNVIGAIIRSL